MTKFFSNKGHFFTNEELEDSHNKNFFKVDININELKAIKEVADFFYEHKQDIDQDLHNFITRNRRFF